MATATGVPMSYLRATGGPNVVTCCGISPIGTAWLTGPQEDDPTTPMMLVAVPDSKYVCGGTMLMYKSGTIKLAVFKVDWLIIMVYSFHMTDKNMTKRVFKTRDCASCQMTYTPTGPRNRWCSLYCRLVDQVDQSAGPNACWPWTRSMDKNGYGEIRINHETYFAHRVSLQILGYTEVRVSDVVRHKCDNPICCNPAHLIIGTQADNVMDMHERNRQQAYKNQAKGSAHHQAKIDEDLALAIFNDRGPRRLVAARFGVSENTVQRIFYGKSWNHVTGLAKK